MLDLPEPGLYRTTEALPSHENDIPKGILVYVGQKADTQEYFVVRPGRNTNNRWYWGDPTTPLRSPTWGRTLHRLPSEGFYVLPETVELSGGGRWLKGAIMQLGYNGNGEGIGFVAERHEREEQNVLKFSDKGVVLKDALLERLIWAPILPVRDDSN